VKPTAFIASSSERRDVAYTVQEILEQQDVEVTVWDQDVIQPSSLVLDGLIRSVDRRHEPCYC
jgi:predicted nucleotide-binding protein